MIKKILIAILCLCISFSTYAKNNEKIKEEVEAIEVTNIFTCYDLNKATLTNGNVIYCVEDRFVKNKIEYDRDKAIEDINGCLSSNPDNNVALLNLLGIVYCIDKNDL